MHKNNVYKVMCTAKNCGLAVIETVRLIEKGVVEHLSNHNVYQKLSEKNARAQLRDVELLVGSFASRWQKRLTRAECTYLKRGSKKKQKQIDKVLHHH